MTSPLEDEFTELVDADIPRVDLVDKAANGTTFLIAKAQGAPGLISADLVRDLIEKAAVEPQPEDDKVTMTGSPAAIAKLIHQAAVRAEARDEVAKEKYDAEDRKRMAANGEAMEDGSYPIADHADLTDAVRAIGRGGADHDAIRRHVIRRAKALGAQSEIPDNWTADGSLKSDVAKEMDMDDDALDPSMLMAEADGDAPGMDTDPGSPAWEEVDAATARKWTSILARAKAAVDMLAQREMLEAAAGDEDDAMHAMELQDACCAIDYAISVLAPFAVAEQAEADCGDDMAMVGKALAAFDPELLDTIEALAHVAKAGRVLSTANEAAIRGAVDSLQKVLASLPAAPTTDEGGQAVAKTANEEPDMPEPTVSADVTEAHGQEPAMGVQQVEPQPVAGQAVTDMAKADGDKPKMMAVFNAKGKLIGIVDPSKITQVDGADGDDGDEGSGADAMDDDATPAADTAPETTDLTPEPPAEAGTPADTVASDNEAVTKTTNDTEMFKSSLLAAVAEAMTEQSATHKEEVAKLAGLLVEQAELVETLKGRIGALEEQPAAPKVFTNGAVPPRDLRGMDRSATPVDVSKAAELRKQLYAPAAADQNAAANELQQMAIDRLQEIHRRGR